MIKEIKNKAFRKAMEENNMGLIKLYKDNGFFFIASDNDEIANNIAKTDHNCIYANSFNQFTIEQWLNEIRSLLE